MLHNEIPPFNKEKPKNLVVLLHGLGSDGQDLISLVPYFYESMPDSHFYSPNGIEKCDMAPFGYQWFSLKNREAKAMIKELETKSEIVLDLIESKLSELKLGFEDLILIGFSQGTMLSLYLATAFEFQIKSVVGFSGAYLPPEIVKNTKTPICLIHGMDDEVVHFDNMNDSKKRLIESNVTNVETFGIKNLGHTIDLSGIDFAVKFLKKHLGKE